MSTLMEDFVKELYTRHGFLRYSDLKIQKLANAFGLNVTFKPTKAYRYGCNIVLSILKPFDVQKASFFHESGHCLRSDGIQTKDVPPPLKELQEWDANRFALHAAMPSFMLQETDLSREGVIQELAEDFNVPESFVRKRLDHYKRQLVQKESDRQRRMMQMIRDGRKINREVY